VFSGEGLTSSDKGLMGFDGAIGLQWSWLAPSLFDYEGSLAPEGW